MDFTKLEADDDDVETGPENDEEISSAEDTEDESGDEDDEANTVAEINRLQDELSHNSYDYEKHIALIRNLKSLGELELLREAREKMNKIFPLSAELWTEWIADETSIATTTEQKTEVLSLYNRAISDYLNTKLWLNYAQYAIGMMDSLKIDQIREILEKSITHAGLNVLDGSLVWGVLRDFECTILSTMGPIGETNSDQINEQIKRIFNIFRRQFSVSLFNMKEDFEEFEKWLEEVDTCYNINLRDHHNQEMISIKSEFEKAIKSLEELEKFEGKISDSDPPHYEQYLEYLDFEIKNKSHNLARTQCLFERAIAENCLQGELWLKYLEYCDSKIVVDTILEPIYIRSTRNCPWVADIWIHYMAAMERLSEKNSQDVYEKVQSIFQQALNNTFSSVDDYKGLWMHYLQFLRRKVSKCNEWQCEDQISLIRQSFDAAIESIVKMSSRDYCYDLYKFYAKVEAKYCKNLENARQIYASLSESSTLKRMAQFWLDYANFELRFGDEKNYRKILLKGMNVCSDYPEQVASVLLQYEQEEGETISQLDVCKSKYKNVASKAAARVEKVEAFTKTSSNSRNTPSKKPENSLKRKAEAAETTENKRKKVEPKTNAQHGVTVKTDESKKDQTVFVSNLDFAIDEEEIKQAFVQFGPITEVRLVRNYKGLSKGYCYVEFESINSAHQSLKHDRMMLRNRPVYISQMEKRNKFAYSVSKENNKLFVKNIPFEFTKEDVVDKIFAEYKEVITDIRLVTYRNGHSKGWAYVEFKDAKSAEKAVLEKNDFEINDRKLIVAISDPSLAKGSKSLIQSNSARKNTSLASSSSMMIPHALRVKTQPSKVKLQLEAGGEKASTSAAVSNGGNEPKKLSNDQFRSMFLK